MAESLEAVVVDATHLELKRPLPLSPGERLLIQIVVESEEEHLLRELEAAYLLMSEQERQEEITLSEEGLLGASEPAMAFPGEEEWPWWE